MIPSKDSFPHAAGLFGRIAGVPVRSMDHPDDVQGASDAEGYRKALLRNAVAFTIGRHNKDRGSAR